MMVNSSPEYAITKPGLQHLRKREKPLRTYGKRSSSTPEARSEPPTKRLRSQGKESLSRTNHPAAQENASLESKTRTKNAAEPIQKASTHSTQDESSTNKQSILNYFKRTLRKAESAPQLLAPISSDIPESRAPIELPRKRPPRLLKIRALVNDNHENSEHEPKSEAKGPPQAQEGPAGDDDEIVDAESDNFSQSRHSSISLGDAINDKPRIHNKEHNPKNKSEYRAKRSPGIQTTLNISAQAAFSECKICDTVWNPLFPDDVKYHTKRHKVVVRAQKKALDDL